jgi:hypothetical protein
MGRKNNTKTKTKTYMGDNIKIGLEELGWCGMGWIVLAQDSVKWRALVKMVWNLRVP